MKNKFAKWKPYIFLAVLLASLVPLVWLGRYNYPTGDDYYYGTEAHLVWRIFPVCFTYHVLEQYSRPPRCGS